jgi:diadenosine tetraphosphate (Ap4A) HIT family hydrolase
MWRRPTTAALNGCWSSPMNESACPLCQSDGGLLLFRNEQLRIIQASEAGFPAFYRVVWDRHVAEFSDLSAEERAICMHAVVTVEQILRSALQPAKINLAALGNVVPHLHWHVVARFDWDSHFPAPVWSTPQRALEAEKLAVLAAGCLDVNRQIAEKMAH